MVDWKQRQKECMFCKGVGFHYGGFGYRPWVSRCKCQPKTMDELKEATEQEKINVTERD